MNFNYELPGWDAPETILIQYLTMVEEDEAEIFWIRTIAQWPDGIEAVIGEAPL